MKKSTKLALWVSLITLIGFPAIFLIVSLLTGQWNYLLLSIAPSLVVGLTSLMITIQQMKRDKQKEVEEGK